MASADLQPDDRSALIVRAAVMLAHVLDMLDLATTPMKHLLATPKPPPDRGLTPSRKRVEVLRQIAENPSRPDAVKLLLAAAAQAQAAYRRELRSQTRPRLFARLAQWLLHRGPVAHTSSRLEVQIQRLDQLSAQLARLSPSSGPARAQLDPPAPAPTPAAMAPGAPPVAAHARVFFANGQGQHQGDDQ